MFVYGYRGGGVLTGLAPAASGTTRRHALLRIGARRASAFAAASDAAVIQAALSVILLVAAGLFVRVSTSGSISTWATTSTDSSHVGLNLAAAARRRAIGRSLATG
jgi:hypothetical protein